MVSLLLEYQSRSWRETPLPSAVSTIQPTKHTPLLTEIQAQHVADQGMRLNLPVVSVSFSLSVFPSARSGLPLLLVSAQDTLPSSHPGDSLHWVSGKWESRTASLVWSLRLLCSCRSCSGCQKLSCSDFCLNNPNPLWVNGCPEEEDREGCG